MQFFLILTLQKCTVSGKYRPKQVLEWGSEVPHGPQESRRRGGEEERGPGNIRRRQITGMKSRERLPENQERKRP